MTSHEWARKVQETVDHLLARPEVDLKNHGDPFLFLHFYEKEQFVSVARALGSGKKEFRNHDLHFIPNGTCLTMVISRNSVCRKVQSEEWECDPLFSDKEVITVGEAEAVDSIF